MVIAFGLLLHFQVYFLAVLRICKTLGVKTRKQDMGQGVGFGEEQSLPRE